MSGPQKQANSYMRCVEVDISQDVIDRPLAYSSWISEADLSVYRYGQFVSFHQGQNSAITLWLF